MSSRTERSLSWPLALTGAIALALGARGLWRESSTACALTAVLLEDVRGFSGDAAPLANDPFTEKAVGSAGGFHERMEAQRRLAREIGNLFAKFHLPIAFMLALQKVDSLDRKSALGYSRALERWQRTAPVPSTCIGVSSGQQAELSAARFLASLRELWAQDQERMSQSRSRLPVLQAEWDQDGQTYCRSLVALRRMREIHEHQKEGCARRGAQSLPASCAPEALERFMTEAKQLERVQNLNEKKLKQKWGERLYAKIHCD